MYVFPEKHLIVSEHNLGDQQHFLPTDATEK